MSQLEDTNHICFSSTFQPQLQRPPSPSKSAQYIRGIRCCFDGAPWLSPRPGISGRRAEVAWRTLVPAPAPPNSLLALRHFSLSQDFILKAKGDASQGQEWPDNLLVQEGVFWGKSISPICQ